MKEITMTAASMVVACALTLLCSCSSQSGSAGAPVAAGQQTSSPAAATASSGKCDVNAMTICKAARNRPVTYGGGITGNTQYQSQNSAATESEIWHFQIPQGSRFDVQCNVNTSIRKVVYANKLSGPAFSDGDLAFLHKTGLCSGETLAISEDDLNKDIIEGQVP